MTYRKKLIEVALPLEAINEASAREKSIRHGHPSTLHLWWARRPLAAARAVIFASLVDDPDAADAPPAFVAACRALPRGKNAIEQDTPRMRLFDFIERLVQWESTTDETVLATARELIQLATDGNPPPLLDPFAGGGSIPLEAQRLGLEAHASDLNPVAVMINKAMIEIPPRFANRPPVNPTDRQQIGGKEAWPRATGLAADVRYYGAWMRAKAWERIGHLYPTHNGETVIAWIWARTVQCPNPACRAQMPLVHSFELSQKKGKETWVEPQVDQTHYLPVVHYQVKSGHGKAPDGTVNRSGATCICCNSAVPFDYIRKEGKADRMGAQIMAIVTEGQNGRNYYTPTHEHNLAATVIVPDDVPDTNLPEKALSFRVQLYGMDKHRKLFSPRQLVALTSFSKLISEVRKQIQGDAIACNLPNDEALLSNGGDGAKAYAEAISVYLAFAVDRASMFWSSLSFWGSHPKDELVKNVFARQSLAMVWDYAEANPFSYSGGNWTGSVNYIAKMLEQMHLINAVGYARQTDATELDSDGQFIVSTDPPYYDNIGYADLSDFFYTWMRMSLRNIYPNLFTTMLVPKEAELISTPFRFNGDRSKADHHFESGLHKAFQNVGKVLLRDYPLTIFYAFKQTEDEMSGVNEGKSTGWETMLAGLITAGFSVNGTWPMRTELTSALKKSVNALASSIVLVCRPRPDDAPTISRRDFVNLLRRELPAALQAMQSGNIAPVDLAQATIGPGMAVYSRYRQVLEANGEALTVRAALQLINQELDAYLSEQEGEVDADTRFAIAWFDQTGFADSDFGLADVLARAKNTSVEGVVQAGIAVAGRGKVRLRHWDDPTWEHGWDPTIDTRVTVWEATHHLIYCLNTQGEGGAARLLLKLGADIGSEARQLAYRLYSIGERKGWADHARAYNALVISWPAIQEEVNRLKQEQAAGAPTEQARLF